MTVGRSGYAFAVEFRTDGTRRLIAHPDPEVVAPQTRHAADQAVRELVPIERLSDRHIGAFLNELPADLTPTDLQGMGRIHFKQDVVHYFGGYRCLATQETPNWLICILLP